MSANERGEKAVSVICVILQGEREDDVAMKFKI
jgi:hypothetical protein